VAREALAAGHAEEASDGATRLRGHAQATARQEDALHRLAIPKLDQQARRAVGAGVLRPQAREGAELRGEFRQRLAQPAGQEVLPPPRALAQRPRANPGNRRTRR